MLPLFVPENGKPDTVRLPATITLLVTVFTARALLPARSASAPFNGDDCDKSVEKGLFGDLKHCQDTPYLTFPQCYLLGLKIAAVLHVDPIHLMTLLSPPCCHADSFTHQLDAQRLCAHLF